MIIKVYKSDPFLPAETRLDIRICGMQHYRTLRILTLCCSRTNFINIPFYNSRVPLFYQMSDAFERMYRLYLTDHLVIYFRGNLDCDDSCFHTSKHARVKCPNIRPLQHSSDTLCRDQWNARSTYHCSRRYHGRRLTWCPSGQFEVNMQIGFLLKI